MSDPFLRLSVDEVAAGLAQAGFSEPARVLLQGYLDQPLSDEAAQQRLIAASHGLLARQLFLPDGEAVSLAPEFAEAMHALGVAPRILRLSLLFADAEIVETILPVAGRFIDHTALYELVHEFRWISDAQALTAWIENFFAVQDITAFDAPPVSMPVEVAQPILAGRSAEEVAERLRAAGAPESTVKLVAEDLRDGVTIGTAAVVEDLQAEPSIECMVLRSHARMWLLTREAPDRATLAPGNPAALREQFQVLVGALQ